MKWSIIRSGAPTYGGLSSCWRRRGCGENCQGRSSFAVAFASISIATGAFGHAALADPGTQQLATPQTLAAKLAGAQSGETLLLASGDYGPLFMRGKSFQGVGLTIQPQPGAKVTFTEIGIAASSGVTIRGVSVDIRSAQFGVSTSGSSNLKFEGLQIYAEPNAAPNAMMLRGSSDITVSDCDIHNLGTGINFLDSDHIRIFRNTFKDIQVDSIRGSSSFVEVVGNHASSFHPRPGDHPDFIQFWGSKTGPSTGNVIKGNVFERGAGDPVQGVFLEDNENVVISGNGLEGTMYNGISLARVHHALVEDNFVQGYRDMGSRIITRGTSSDVVIRNNISQSIMTYNDGGKPNPNYKEEHNKSIGGASVGDTKALQEWLARRG